MVDNYSKLISINKYVKAMRGTSNRKFILKRADGWCESVYGACESLLEQGMERPLKGQ
jgi:hypothetical protein